MAKPKGRPGKGLGKGLGTLLGEDTFKKVEESKHATTKIKVADIDPNPNQPRLRFDQEALNTLIESIKQYGLVQPVVVRKNGDRYELVAGERRWRACKALKFTEIEALVKDYSTEQTTEIALVENLQRQDLDPIEEAHAYKRLKDKFKLTQEEIATKLGRSRSHIANIIRLLNLSQPVQNLLSAGEITIGQARPMLSLKTQELQEKMLEIVAQRGLNARQIEELVKVWNEPASKKEKTKRNENEGSAEIRSWEDRLKISLGTPVGIKFKAGKEAKGKIEIAFKSETELTRLLAFLEQSLGAVSTNKKAKANKNFVV